MIKKDTKWQLIKEEDGTDLNILKIRFHHYLNPRNEKVVKTISIAAHDAANVIAQNAEGKIIMVRQFRFGIGDYTLEIPGGIIDPGETPQEAARRELEEEAGVKAANWQLLGSIQSNPVWMNSNIYHFYTKITTAGLPLKLDDAEDVLLEEWTPQEIYDMIDEGIIRHPHTISAFYFAQRILKKPESS